MRLVFRLNRLRGSRHSGAAAVEMAIVLPILCVIMAGALDYARALSFAVITMNCARNGAIYGANPSASPFLSLTAAAQADFNTNDYSFVTTLPAIVSSYATDSNGISYVKVTATYNFKTIIYYPGIPNNVTIARSVIAAIAP